MREYQPKFDYFAALIYATDTEEAAVRGLFDWTDVTLPYDGQKYYESAVTRNGETLKIVAARQREMGMVAAATLSMKLIENWHPQYLIMPGILAGGKKQSSKGEFFGDVVLAEAVWNCSNGKYVSSDKSDITFGSVGFIARPTCVELPYKLTDVLERAAEYENNEFTIHFGYVASGNCVVANREIVAKHVTSQKYDTQGLDMEAYGVAYATRESRKPRPYPIIAKSICDFANGEKSDRYQKFAAYNSCQFCRYLIEEVLPLRSDDEDFFQQDSSCVKD